MKKNNKVMYDVGENSMIEEKGGFKRILSIIPPFDRRHKDPNKNYGIHGVELRFVLVKDKKATQFVVYTPMHLPHVEDEFKKVITKTMGADVGYHSPYPMYERQPKGANCPYTDGDCYYDGSGLRAEEWCKIWLEKGTDAIWRKLEKEWKIMFGAPVA